MPNCPKCREPTFPEDQFCGVCGNPLGGGPPPFTPPTPSYGGGAKTQCPTCGFMNESDAFFCENDGTPLQKGVPPGPPIGVPPAPSPIATVNGVLVMPDQSEVPLPATTRVFGRNAFLRYIKEENTKEISRAHFTITQDSGAFYVQDGGPDPKNQQVWKASVNGTSVNGVLLQPGMRQRLNPNDVIDVAQLGLNLVFKVK